MELWVAFGFGAAVGTLIGYLLGRQREVPAPPLRPRLTPAAPAPSPVPPPKAGPPKTAPAPDLTRVVLDEGSANVLNALNNRLAAIGGLADLLHGSPLDPERARARAAPR